MAMRGSTSLSLRGARSFFGVTFAILWVALAVSAMPSCNPTPEACNFTDCGPDQARLIDVNTGQDICVPVLDPNEACDTNITSVCAQGHACINGTCQPAPVFSEFCGIFGEGQCAYSFGTGQPLFCGCPPTSGPLAGNPFFRLCGLYASINNSCDSNAADPLCAPCEPGLQCLDGFCSKLCATDDDCPCGANGQPNTTCSTVPEGTTPDVLRCIRCTSLGDRCNLSNRPCCDEGESCGPANVCCRDYDAECSTAADCCDPTGVCFNGTCRPCGTLGTGCSSGAECCGGLTCRGGLCAEPCESGSCTVPGAQGECAKGTWFCDRLGNTCIPNAGPTPEVCDGDDNDCDGQTDEGIPPTDCTDPENITCQDGFQGPAKTRCVGGELVCEAEVCEQGDDPATCVCTGCTNGPPCGFCQNQPCTGFCIPNWECETTGGPNDECKHNTFCANPGGFVQCWTGEQTGTCIP